MKHWAPAQLATLRRLREGFLTGAAGAADYWRSPDDLALYDATFGERIGWKWDAVLRELAARRWEPRTRCILDWGCGSGIAGRRVLAHWPQYESVALHDRSPLALRFAADALRRHFPSVEIRAGETGARGTLLLISHVLGELDAAALTHLLALAREAGEIIWVEAGTHADSRRLIEVREQLLGEFAAVAPCTHQVRCGMLAAENSRHWCHHFAAPPAEAFQDARWAELGRELGIDLRALPYSFLVLERPRAIPPIPPGFSRIIGEPRHSKGYSRVLSCQAEGVAEFVLQKRDDPELLRELKRGTTPIYRWKVQDGKIVAAASLPR